MSSDNFEKITAAGIITGIDKYNFEDWFMDLLDKFKKDYSPEKLKIEENSEEYDFWKYKILGLIFIVCMKQAQNENINNLKRFFKKELGKEFFEKALKDLIDIIIFDFKKAIDLLRGIFIRDCGRLCLEGITEEQAMETLNGTYTELVERLSNQEGFLER